MNGSRMRERRLPGAVCPLAFVVAVVSAASAIGAEPAPLAGAVSEPSTFVTPAQALANNQTPSITIMIPATGPSWVEKRSGGQGAPKDQLVQISDSQPAALEKALDTLSAGDRDLQIYILADRNARFQTYVDVLKVLRQLRFARISIIAIEASKKEK